MSATRLHFPDGTSEIPEITVKHLKEYANSTRRLGISCAVAVNCLEDTVRNILLEAAPDLRVAVLHVPVWGAFVAALNTLLGEAQRQNTPYILYQSLEVTCSPPVLRLLLDHFTPDVLVVGPVLDGHTFKPGVQDLNGRTTPWNTLALWSTRKLGLTGFLAVADGIPQAKKNTFSRQITGEPQHFDYDRHLSGDSGDESFATPKAMGSTSWWEGGKGSDVKPPRQVTESTQVPAGVEEVTAIALLQHLLGHTRARAILVMPPPEMAEDVSWAANWAGDERRKQWHEYKMASKVARPAAQIRRLFAHKSSVKAHLQAPLLMCMCAEEQEPKLNFGTVMHFGTSIRPPRQVELICLFSVGLFSANFASSFAVAFRVYNAARQAHVSFFNQLVFVFLLIGGVYLPMPLSLELTRALAARYDHIAGFAMFAGVLLFGHLATIVCEAGGAAIDDDASREAFVITMRVIQGLGSGVLFQARFVLASLSTQDHHQRVQALMLFASDVGFGLGALLPWVVSCFFGSDDSNTAHAQVAISTALAIVSLAHLVWIFVAFPSKIHRLPHKVRFQERKAVGASFLQEGRGSFDANEKPIQPVLSTVSSVGDFGDGRLSLAQPKDEASQWKVRLIFSGTLRASVQSAAMMMVALLMLHAGKTGAFQQTNAIAALSLVPAPFEAMSTGQWFGLAAARAEAKSERADMRALTVICLAVLLFVVSWLADALSSPSEVAIVVGLELAALLVALAIAAPRHASRLYAQRDAEADMVVLEWLKAYVGRLLAPVIAIVVQTVFGYQALLALLTVSVVGVALTA